MNTLLYIPPSEELTKFIEDKTLQNYNTPVLVGEEHRQEFIRQFDRIKNLINTELAKFNKPTEDKIALTTQQVEELQKELNIKRLFIDLVAMGNDNLELVFNNFGINVESSNYLNPYDKLLVKKGYLSAHCSNQCVLPNTLIPYVTKSLWDVFGENINELLTESCLGGMFGSPLSDYQFGIIHEKGQFYQAKKKYIQWWVNSKYNNDSSRIKDFGFLTASRLDNRIVYIPLKQSPWQMPASRSILPMKETPSISTRLKTYYDNTLKEIWTLLKLRDGDSDGNISFTLTKTLNLWDWSWYERMSPSRLLPLERKLKDAAMLEMPKPVLVPSVQACLDDWDLFQQAHALPCKTYVIDGKVHKIKHRYYELPSMPPSLESVPPSYEQLQQQREQEFIYSKEQRIAALNALYEDLDKCDEKGILIEINVSHNAFD